MNQAHVPNPKSIRDFRGPRISAEIKLRCVCDGVSGSKPNELADVERLQGAARVPECQSDGPDSSPALRSWKLSLPRRRAIYLSSEGLSWRIKLPHARRRAGVVKGEMSVPAIPQLAPPAVTS
jgi:hypothetical protein